MLMKMFGIVVFGLLLFLVLGSNSPPVLNETDITQCIELELPGENLIAINEPVELRAPEVVTIYSSFESCILIKELSERNTIIGNEQISVFENNINLNDLVLPLLLPEINISYDKNSIYDMQLGSETKVMEIVETGNWFHLSLFYNSFIA